MPTLPPVGCNTTYEEVFVADDVPSMVRSPLAAEEPYRLGTVFDVNAISPLRATLR
jgi:hypothetical protein